MQAFVDNKRKQLEKSLSAAQRDQTFLKLAKDELKMKEVMVASVKGTATQTSKAIDKIVESISSFSKGDSLAMIAMVMAPPQRQQVPTTSQDSQMPIFSSHPSSQYQSPLQAPNMPHSTEGTFYGNMTSTTLQETGERYQNLQFFRDTSKKIFVFGKVIFNQSNFPIFLNDIFHCMKILRQHLHVQSQQRKSVKYVLSKQ